LIFIELPKFDKTIEECKNVEDKWLYFIKNSEDLTVVPENIDKTIKDAYEIANTANYTMDELELQRKRKEFIYIQKNSIEKAKRDGKNQGLKEGLEKGIEQGLEQGERNKQIEIAKNLLKAKVDIDTIVISTGLNKDEIESLRK